MDDPDNRPPVDHTDAIFYTLAVLLTAAALFILNVT